MGDSSGAVLVTGGTGFLGGWCVALLLEREYEVRTTVRDLAREQAVRDAVGAAGVDPGSRLTVLAADLVSDTGWAEAVAGSRYVLHVASPFPPVQTEGSGRADRPGSGWRAARARRRPGCWCRARGDDVFDRRGPL